MAQQEFAQTYEPEYAEARLMKGQLLIAQKTLRWTWRTGTIPAGAARGCRREKIAGIMSTGKANDPALLFALAEVFQRQKIPGSRSGFWRTFTSLPAQQVVVLYRKQIETSWPGLRIV